MFAFYIFKLRQIRVITCLILMLFIQREAFAMSIFNLCLSSEIKGKVVLNNKPVINAKIIRTLKWDSMHITNEISTDESGSFVFPPQFKFSIFWTLFPHNPSIGQQIHIHYKGKQYQAWGFRKGNYDINGELDGKPMNMICDLNNPRKVVEINTLKDYIGICEIK